MAIKPEEERRAAPADGTRRRPGRWPGAGAAAPRVAVWHSRRGPGRRRGRSRRRRDHGQTCLRGPGHSAGKFRALWAFRLSRHDEAPTPGRGARHLPPERRPGPDVWAAKAGHRSLRFDGTPRRLAGHAPRVRAHRVRCALRDILQELRHIPNASSADLQPPGQAPWPAHVDPAGQCRLQLPSYDFAAAVERRCRKPIAAAGWWRPSIVPDLAGAPRGRAVR
jgi:hypothetical protein